MEKKTHPVISVIVPVYKVEKYIRKCIESILNQTFYNFQLVLIDDGSPDDCPKICDEYAKKDERIVVVHQNNSGVSIARQVGVAQALGDYLAFVDSDDWVEEDFLKEINKIIDTFEPDIICFGGNIVIDDVYNRYPFPMESKLYNRKQIIERIFPYLIEDSSGKYFPNELWRKVIKKDLYINNQVIDKKIMMGEDAACIKPCFYHANSIYIDKGLYYNYRCNDGSITSSGKPLLWDGPELIAQHYSEHMNLEEYDFREQVNRNLVHNLFNVAVSQYSREESLFKVSKRIRKELNDKYYKEIVKKVKFSSFEGKICRMAVRYKICFIFYLRWYQKFRRKQ